MSRPRLTVTTARVSALGEADVAALFELFERYYERADEQRFREDLSKKQRVIVMRDAESRELGGFSTVRLMEPDELGRRCRVIYSGDTVVDERYWGGKALQLGFTRLIFRQRWSRPTVPLYWLLTTKGYKTYLLLTNYFPEAYPRHDRPTPQAMAELQDWIGGLRYGDAYDGEHGIVRLQETRDRLRQGVAEIGERELADPHIRHFAELNPDHRRGDELLCLARIRLVDPPRIMAKLALQKLGLMPKRRP